jgi:hypothetical protein
MEEKTYNLGRQILKENDIQKTLVVGEYKDTFKVHFPNPLEQEAIERDVAMRMGGVPLDAYPQTAYNALRMNVTLDRVVLEKPEWWQYTNFAECYDEELVSALWEAYLEARESFRGSIRKCRFSKPSP